MVTSGAAGFTPGPGLIGPGSRCGSAVLAPTRVVAGRARGRVATVPVPPAGSPTVMFSTAAWLAAEHQGGRAEGAQRCVLRTSST